MSAGRIFVMAVFGLLGARCALAADPQSLSTNVPVPTQDALAVNVGTLELQGTGVYTRDHYNSAGRDLLLLNPTLKIGALKHLQLDISVPYGVGSQSAASQGNGSVDALYQFNDPSPAIPAIGFQGGYQFFEYGPGHKSNNYFLRALATQWLGSDAAAPRLHLNLNWTHVTEPGRTSRREQLEIGVATSMLLSPSAALVVDVVHGAKPAKAQNETVADAGIRYLVSDTLALGGAVGVGIGQQSPAARVLFFMQKDFRLF